MKKTLLIFGFIAAICFSCKKDYTCTCQFSGGAKISETYMNVKKSDASSSCSEKETMYKPSDASTTCTVNEN